MQDVQRVCEFLKKCSAYFLATEDGGQPRVRPFGTAHVFEGRLYLQTGKAKNVYRQMKANPKVELCGMAGDQWIRVEATAVEDDRVAARQSMLDAYPSLQAMYRADDGNTAVFYLKDASAAINSQSGAPEVFKF